MNATHAEGVRCVLEVDDTWLEYNHAEEEEVTPKLWRAIERIKPRADFGVSLADSPVAQEPLGGDAPRTFGMSYDALIVRTFAGPNRGDRDSDPVGEPPTPSSGRRLMKQTV